MALKTKFFFLLFFLAVLIWSLFMDTTNIVRGTSEEIAAIEFEDFEIYNITTDGVIESLFADRGLHFANRNILYNGYIYRGTTGEIEGISGDTIEIHPEKLLIHGTGRYMSTEGYELHAKEIIYNKAENLVATNGTFEIFYKQDKLTGQDLIFNLDTRVLKADTIQAKFTIN